MPSDTRIKAAITNGLYVLSLQAMNEWREMEAKARAQRAANDPCAALTERYSAALMVKSNVIFAAWKAARA